MRRLLLCYLLCVSAVAWADKPRWYQYPGNWFKSVLASPQKGEVAPAVLAVSEHGEAFDVTDIHTDYVVYVFWASWCPICREKLPSLDALAATFDNVTPVAVNVLDDEEEALAFIKPLGLKALSYYDESGKTAKTYGVSALPLNVLVDAKTHNIVKRWSGKKAMAEEIRPWVVQPH